MLLPVVALMVSIVFLFAASFVNSLVGKKARAGLTLLRQVMREKRGLTTEEDSHLMTELKKISGLEKVRGIFFTLSAVLGLGAFAFMLFSVMF